MSGFFDVFGGGFFSTPSFKSNLIPGYIADFDSRYGITLDGNGKVSQWDERWGNGWSYSQSTDTKRPTILANAFGGAQALVGNPTNLVHLVGNATARSGMLNQTGLTLYAIVKTRLAGGYMFGVATNASTTGRIAWGGGRNLSLAGRGIDSDSAVYTTGDPANGNTAFADLPGFQIISHTVDYANKVGQLFRNGVRIGHRSGFTISSPTPNTSALDTCLMSFRPTTGFWDGDLVRFVICSGIHSKAQMYDTNVGLRSEYSNPYLPVVATSPSLIVQCHGDSITHGSTLSAYSKTMPDRLWENLGQTSDRMVVNLGRSGATSLTLNTDRAFSVDVLPTTDAGKVVYCIWGGVNDIAAGTTGAQVYTNLKTMFLAAKAARPNVRVVICTPIAWGGATGGQRTQLVALRDAIIANAVADGADAVCDLGGLSQFLTASTTLPNDTTYYNADKLHLVDAGNVLVANAIAATISSLP